MEWISKTPPIYIWKEDTWNKEPEYKRYYPDLSRGLWWNPDNDDKFLFTKKTRIMSK